VKRLLIILALPLIVSACGLADNRDVRAYNACMARHPEDAVICEGPRQAYEVDSPATKTASKN
jgi:hypothetical protein